MAKPVSRSEDIPACGIDSIEWRERGQTNDLALLLMFRDSVLSQWCWCIVILDETRIEKDRSMKNSRSSVCDRWRGQ